MATISGPTNMAFLEELLAFTADDRNDLAVRLVEINALWTEGEISDEEFARRRVDLYH